MNGGIYTIRVQGSEKFYVGRTISFPKRKAHHMWLLRRERHHCKHLQNAFNKYGSVEFVEEIVENDKERRIQLEQEWIDRHKDGGVLVNHQMKATNDDVGGKKWKEDRSRVPHNKGKPSPLFGVKRDPAIAKKISEAKKKKGQTEKQLQALAENRKNIDYKKPRTPMSEAARKHLGELRAGVKRGPYKTKGAGK
jgi:group I intron endonuclease